MSEVPQENPLLEANMSEREYEFAWTRRIAPEPKGAMKWVDHVEAESSVDNRESLEEYLSEQIAALHFEAEIEQLGRFGRGSACRMGEHVIWLSA